MNEDYKAFAEAVLLVDGSADEGVARFVASALQGIALGLEEAGAAASGAALRLSGAEVVRLIASGEWRAELPPRKAPCAKCEGHGEVGCGVCRGTGLGFTSDDCTACDAGIKACDQCEGHGEVEAAHVVDGLVCRHCNDHLSLPVASAIREAWLAEHARCARTELSEV